MDFVGGKLAALASVHDVSVEPVLHMTRGRAEIVSARPLHEIRGYRVMFDVVPLEDSTQQIDIRLYLRDTNGEPLTETWLYQWMPPILEERKMY